jgi:pimeloyl-ACP methyl ester carboxylesterase
MTPARGRGGRLLAAIMVAGVALLASCTSSPTSSSPSSAASHSPSSTASGKAPSTAAAGLGYSPEPCAHFNPVFEGAPELDLPATAHCGYLSVPENRSKPGSRSIRIAVARLPAVAERPRPDPILFLAGGPGNTSFANAVGLIQAGWNRERDVILVDQRGTLKAQPLLACPQVDEYLRAAMHLAPTRSRAAAEELAAVRACRDSLTAEGWDLSAFNTTENAADVADLRIAMGIAEWNVYGVSYGTDLALQTLRDHPDGIRTVVLDSVLPPQVNLIAQGWPNAAIAYRSLFDACANQPACATSFPNLEREFRSLVSTLTSRPRIVQVMDPATKAPVDVVVDGYTLANLVLVQMAPGSINGLPALIHDLATGKGAVAATALLRRPPIGLAGWGLNYGVHCREQAPFTNQREVDRLAREAFREFPDAVLARVPQLFTPLQNCAAWDVPAAPDSVRTAAASDLPVLIFAGGLDPITPQIWAEEAASGLTQSRLIRAPSAGHDVMHWESACAVPLMHSFLNSPDRALNDCLARATIPRFTTT